MNQRLDPAMLNRTENILEWRKIRTGIELDFGLEKGRIELPGKNLIRIRFSMGGSFDDQPGSGVLAPPVGRVPFSIRESSKLLLIESADIKVRIERQNFAVSAVRKNGETIFSTYADSRSIGAAYAWVNNRFAISLERGKHDRLLGFGEKTGPLDKSGRRLQMWNTDILAPSASGEIMAEIPDDDPARDPKSPLFDPYYISIPFFYHLDKQGEAAGFFFDNPHRAYFDLQHDNHYVCEFSGGQLDLYIFAGPRMNEILSAYTELTGRMSLPPLWALGNHQCRWHQYDEKRLREIAGEFRKRGIPCDSLWLDINYMDGYRVFSWDNKLLPDPPALHAELNNAGFQVVTIVDPGIKYDPEYPVCAEAIRKNLFCKCRNGSLFMGGVWPGMTVFPDFVKEETRSWWADKCAKHISENNLSGIWNDMNEPAVHGVDVEEMRFDRDGADYDHEQFHNQYALLMAEATVDGFRQANPDGRPFVLSRAGSPGIQRVAANWLGDNCSRWEHLEMMISMANGLSISGQPFVGADVGGFCENTSPELLARWAQAAALNPFFRNHNGIGQRDQYPWSMGPAVEDAYRRALVLRYRLLPYLYTVFVKSTRDGSPVQRPLVYDFQTDPIAVEIDDQFMLGDKLLVAPVCRPGQVARQLYLPAGADWYDYYRGDIYSGGQYIAVPAPVDEVPLFVRAGSVIPTLAADIQHTGEYFDAELALHVFLPVEDGTWTSGLYEDDGKTLAALREGAFSEKEFTLRRKGLRVDVKTRSSGNGFPQARTAEPQILLEAPDEELDVFWSGKKIELD